jgi:hypothetical protein
VFLSLPLHHPALTGMIAAGANMTQRERDLLGLDRFTPKSLGGPLPPFRQASVPTPGGSIIPTSRYTSFGVFSDAPIGLTEFLFPWAIPIINAGKGVDWKGDKLVNGKGEPLTEIQRYSAIAMGLSDSFIPAVALGRRMFVARGRYELGGGLFHPPDQKKASLGKTALNVGFPPSKVVKAPAIQAARSKQMGKKAKVGGGGGGGVKRSTGGGGVSRSGGVR